MVFTSDYPILHVTVDAVVLAGSGDDLRVLVVRRAAEPARGLFALPGGFVDYDEDLPAAVVRELWEETGLELPELAFTQLGAYGAPGRDPRHRTVTVAFVARLDEPAAVRGGDDADQALWLPVADLRHRGGLAFDHDQILADALARA